MRWCILFRSIVAALMEAAAREWMQLLGASYWIYTVREVAAAWGGCADTEDSKTPLVFKRLPTRTMRRMKMTMRMRAKWWSMRLRRSERGVVPQLGTIPLYCLVSQVVATWRKDTSFSFFLLRTGTQLNSALIYFGIFRGRFHRF